MAVKFEYYDDWQGQPLSCSCGWTGVLDDDGTELYDALMDYKCPRCERVLAIIMYPTDQDIHETAAKGHPQALAQLARMRGGG